MPTPRQDEPKDEFIDRCIPIVIEDETAEDEKQATAVCNSLWEQAMTEKTNNENDRLVLDMLMTKAEQMSDGRVRWQARANSGNFDLVNERFDRSFWQDVVKNFAVQQDAISRGEHPPAPLTIPILDITHYSLKTEPRDLARGGYPVKIWVDGKALMAQGYFDLSPLGRAMAKAAQSRPVQDRRVSICVFPDWGNVERIDDKTIYKGGRGIAFLDHLAMTSKPMDPDTALAVKSEVVMTTQKDDALAVLGDDAAGLIDELETAKTKTAAGDVLVKAEDETENVEATDVDETETPEQDTTETAETDAETDGEEPETSTDEPPEPEPKSESVADEMRAVLGDFVQELGKSIDERLGVLEKSIPERLDEMQARIDALGAGETEKVKAAIDGDGEWWTRLAKTVRKSSVQRERAVEDGAKAKGPVETGQYDDYRSRFTVPNNQGE